MSIIERADAEMRAAGWDDEDRTAMLVILAIFLNHWDSGGAVSVVAPALQRLMAGKPLTPLTGADDEWIAHADGVFQNRRCSTVFKGPRFHGGRLAYDISRADDPRGAITFPYWPEESRVPSPVIVVDTGEG